jgi:pimeloyl-ACP methyl ester carboxylesterase
VGLALAPLLALAVLVFGPVPASLSYETRSEISYDLGSPPADPARNRLDIYLPETESSTPRPFVMHIHGGGWRVGDKANASIPDKAALFTGLGYGLVSINYRLSPQTGDPDNPDSSRIMFPDHPDDVGEAIGWLDRNALSYGLDPDRIILMGHSAGAHLASLVSTNPRYVQRYGVDRRQILGTIPLDTAAFDIEQSVVGSDPDEPSLLFMNAFGTPEENAATGSWAEASPLTWADATDARHLFLVQNLPSRINIQLTMATKLGQDSTSVVPLPLNHNGVSRAIGRPDDSTQATPAVTAFIAERLAAYEAPSVRITGRPNGTVFLKRKGRGKGMAVRKKEITFRFTGSENRSGFLCRLDGAPFRSCTSPARFRIGPGKHTFRVRPLYPSGRPGPISEAKVTATVKSRR